MHAFRRLLLVGFLLLSLTANAQVVNKAYSTRLYLDEPIPVGANRTITGGGALDSLGVYVELWRKSASASTPESLGSVPVGGGRFSFEGVDVARGDAYWVTLSRSWNFETDGDFEGWDQQVSSDAMVEVRDGVLRITVHDGNGDGFFDPYLHNFSRYHPALYRVVEVRLRNLSAVSPSLLGVFFGRAWPINIAMHNAEIPASMTDFETFLLPMNVDETRIRPLPVEHSVDGLWVSGALNDCLRIDPLNSLPRFHPGADGAVIEIDHIRIREDYRLEFNADGDLSGIDVTQDMSNLAVAAGFFSYDVVGAPSFFSNLMTGKLESGHFTRFVIGLEGSSVLNEPNEIGLSFRDDDSGTGYVDDDGSQQTALFSASFAGRQDVVVDLDGATAGEWSEDGGVHVQGLEVAAPFTAAAGDHVRIDYVGFIPRSPFGPSDTIMAFSPNSPPVAVILTEPDPPTVKLIDWTVSVVLDGSSSDDGDGGTQVLSFAWEKVSGPAGDVVEAPAQAMTRVVFSEAGEYVYRLTIDDGELTDSTDVTVLVKEPIFLRGDVNANGVSLEIADALDLSSYLLGAGAPPVCLDAADVDDSGSLDGSDVVAILRSSHGGDDIDASFLGCGPDETEDELRGCRYPEDLCATATVASPTSGKSGCGRSSFRRGRR